MDLKGNVENFILTFAEQNFYLVDGDYRVSVALISAISVIGIITTLCTYILKNYIYSKSLPIKEEEIKTIKGSVLPSTKKEQCIIKDDKIDIDKEKWLKAKDLVKLLTLNKTEINGLVGILIKNEVAAMVEINCENDDLIYEKEFQMLVHDLAVACIDLTIKITSYKSPPTINKIYLDSEQLNDLKNAVGVVFTNEFEKKGHKITLKRAFCYKVSKSIRLFGYTYPNRIIEAGSSLGKYGTIIALKVNSNTYEGIEDFGEKLCQHIICNNPIKSDSAYLINTSLEKDCCLIHQDYIHDESQKIGNILKQHDVEVLDFKRFVCGETESLSEM